MNKTIFKPGIKVFACDSETIYFAGVTKSYMISAGSYQLIRILVTKSFHSSYPVNTVEQLYCRYIFPRNVVKQGKKPIIPFGKHIWVSDNAAT